MLVEEVLIVEVILSLKFGLVDVLDVGVYFDMDYVLFFKFVKMLIFFFEEMV